VNEAQSPDTALSVCPIAAAQRPVAAPKQQLTSVVCGEDDDGVLVVAILAEGGGHVATVLSTADTMVAYGMLSMSRTAGA